MYQDCIDSIKKSGFWVGLHYMIFWTTENEQKIHNIIPGGMASRDFFEAVNYAAQLSLKFDNVVVYNKELTKELVVFRKLN